MPRCFARLRAVGLVHDKGIATARELADFLGDEGELLERGNDDRRAGAQRVSELLAVLVDLLDDALLVLELIDVVLQLLVEHAPIGDHDHRVEHALILLVVQAREPVSEPCDRVALSRAGRVLHQVILAHAIASRGRLEPANGVELVVARKDDAFLDLRLAVPRLFLFDLEVREAPQDVEEAVSLPDLLPQVPSAIAARVLRVAGPAAIAPG